MGLQIARSRSYSYTFGPKTVDVYVPESLGQDGPRIDAKINIYIYIYMFIYMYEYIYIY